MRISRRIYRRNRRSAAPTAASTASSCTGCRGCYTVLTGFPAIDIVTISGVRNGLIDWPDVGIRRVLPIHHLSRFHHSAMTGDRKSVVVHVHVDIVMGL